MDSIGYALCVCMYVLAPDMCVRIGDRRGIKEVMNLKQSGDGKSLGKSRTE